MHVRKVSYQISLSCPHMLISDDTFRFYGIPDQPVRTVQANLGWHFTCIKPSFLKTRLMYYFFKVTCHLRYEQLHLSYMRTTKTRISLLFTLYNQRLCCRCIINRLYTSKSNHFSSVDLFVCIVDITFREMVPHIVKIGYITSCCICFCQVL